MIKLVMCLRRKPGLSRSEFQEYWQNNHAPLFMRFADSYGTRKYLQDHTLDTPLNDAIRASRGMGEPYDGVAEVWFDSEESLVNAMSSAEGQELSAKLLADEANFLDHARCSAFVTREVRF